MAEAAMKTGSGGASVTTIGELRVRRLVPLLRGPVDVYPVCDEDPGAWVLVVRFRSGSALYLGGLDSMTIEVEGRAGATARTEVIHRAERTGYSVTVTVRVETSTTLPKAIAPIAAVTFRSEAGPEALERRFEAIWHPEKWSRAGL